MIASKRSISWKDVARHYDDLDQVYRKSWGKHLHHGLWTSSTRSAEEAVENLSKRVMDLLEIKGGSNVCDIGCGYAATARLIAESFSADVTGFTISKAQFDQAQLNRPERGNVTLCLVNWLENDLLDESFDHAYSMESSEHMEDKRRFFSEACRVLKPGGTFVVCAWLASDSPGSLERSLLLEPICRHGRLAGLGTRMEYEEMLREAGFLVRRFEDISGQVSRTWEICSTRFLRSLLKDPSPLRLLFQRENPQIGFFLSLFRIRVAYSLGAMRYGVFKATKPL